MVVGLSGGQDSLCLLHALRNSALGWTVVAVHVDHALRATSAADAEQVRALGERLGTRVEVVRVDVPAHRRRLGRGTSVQLAARGARYQALAVASARLDAAAIFVGHTADDQAETLLLHLLRGSGSAGLVGMRTWALVEPSAWGPAVEHLGQPPQPGTWLARPLLGVERRTTLAYCQMYGLPVIEDPSNRLRAYTRNRVRLDLLPALEAFNPAIRRVLSRTAGLLAEDEESLRSITEDLHARLACATETGPISYPRTAWSALPRGLQRRLLREGIRTLRGTLVNVSLGALDDALDFVTPVRAGRRSYDLPGGLRLRAERERLYLEAREGLNLAGA